MSVILYDHTEILQMLAVTWNHGSIGSLENLRRMDRLAETAQRIMAANLAAYNETYPNDAATGLHDLSGLALPPISGRDIKGAIIRQTVDDRLRGIRTLRGLRYNMVANNGQDFASAEVLDDLLSLMTAAYEISYRRAA